MKKTKKVRIDPTFPDQGIQYPTYMGSQSASPDKAGNYTDPNSPSGDRGMYQ